MSNLRLELRGRVFGDLTGLGEVGSHKGSIVWKFLCVCGELPEYPAYRVHSGRVTRCRDCWLKALRRGRAPRRYPPRKVRLASLQSLHPREATTWRSMLQRCSPTNKFYARNYAARGVGLEHKPWKVFSEFYRDMGERPDGMSLDRIDNDRGYSPSNCRWATPSQQISNTRVAHRIQTPRGTLTASKLAAELGVSVSAICNRIKKYGLKSVSDWAATKMEKPQ